MDFECYCLRWPQTAATGALAAKMTAGRALPHRKFPLSLQPPNGTQQRAISPVIVAAPICCWLRYRAINQSIVILQKEAPLSLCSHLVLQLAISSMTGPFAASFCLWVRQDPQSEKSGLEAYFAPWLCCFSLRCSFSWRITSRYGTGG